MHEQNHSIYNLQHLFKEGYHRPAINDGSRDTKFHVMSVILILLKMGKVNGS
jgi:hypothetical protein